MFCSNLPSLAVIILVVIVVGLILTLILKYSNTQGGNPNRSS